MQSIGAAAQGQPRPNQGMQSLFQSIENLGKATMEVTQLAAAVHPPLMAYVSQIAQVGEAMRSEVQRLLSNMQAGGAQTVQPGMSSPTPTEGAPLAA